MRTGTTFTIPIASPEYNEINERTTRRTIEQRFEDIRFDMIDSRDKLTSTSSLPLRRFQFLLMGASGV